jgi:hypothetical protein
MEKDRVQRMTGPGYDLQVPWSVRIHQLRRVRPRRELERRQHRAAQHIARLHQPQTWRPDAKRFYSFAQVGDVASLTPTPAVPTMPSWDGLRRLGTCHGAPGQTGGTSGGPLEPSPVTGYAARAAYRPWSDDQAVVGTTLHEPAPGSRHHDLIGNCCNRGQASAPMVIVVRLDGQRPRNACCTARFGHRESKGHWSPRPGPSTRGSRQAAYGAIADALLLGHRRKPVARWEPTTVSYPSRAGPTM